MNIGERVIVTIETPVYNHTEELLDKFPDLKLSKPLDEHPAVYIVCLWHNSKGKLIGRDKYWATVKFDTGKVRKVPVEDVCRDNWHYECIDFKEELKTKTTKNLLLMLESSRHTHSTFYGYGDMIKAELDTREHVPKGRKGRLWKIEQGKKQRGKGRRDR